jgi:hypothetical protein
MSLVTMPKLLIEKIKSKFVIGDLTNETFTTTKTGINGPIITYYRYTDELIIWASSPERINDVYEINSGVIIKYDIDILNEFRIEYSRDVNSGNTNQRPYIVYGNKKYNVDHVINSAKIFHAPYTTTINDGISTTNLTTISHLYDLLCMLDK